VERGRTSAWTTVRTSWSLRTLQEQTIIDGFRRQPSILHPPAPSKRKAQPL
jgi:hypothetical protein